MPSNPTLLKNSAYILPNMMTAFNLICGLLAIIIALESYGITEPGSKYYLAAWLIIAAMVFDFLDGKVARWTHTESHFGVKIDSLTDFVSFGVAPVVIAYATVLQSTVIGLRLPAVGLFLLAGAWRLARFNCETMPDHTATHFTGLPIPAAAVFICTLVLVNKDHAQSIEPALIGRSFSSFSPELGSIFFACLMIGLAFLMVSRIPFPAFKRVNRRNMMILAGVALFFAVLSLLLPLENIVFLIMLLYVFIGLFQYFLERAIQQYLRQKRS